MSNQVALNKKYAAYPEYKDSGAEWLEQIPSSWDVIRVGHLFKRVKRIGFEDRELLSVYRDYGVVPKNSRDDNNNRPSDDLSPYQLVEPKDLVLNKMKAWQGSVAVSDFEGIVSPAYFVYKPVGHRGETYDSKFMHYLLRCPVYIAQYFRHSKGIRVNQWDLDPDSFKAVEVLLPSPEEQRTIAAFLDYETARIDQLIAKQQRLIELLKEKRQAVISHAVTNGLNPNAPMKDSGVEWLGQVPEHWRIRRLKQVIECGTSISYGIVQPGDALDEGVPFIQTTNISRGNLSFDDLPKTSALIEKNYPRSRLTGGEVILGIRASIGAAYVVPSELKGANLSRGVARIQTNEVLSSEFLVRFFQSNSVEQYWGLSKQGSTFSEVSIETVRELYVTIPSKNEQNEICSHLDLITNKFDSLITLAEQQNILLWERRTALISAAVTGKIDVRGWNVSNERNSV